MLKPKYLNVLLCFFIKYVAFFICLAFIGSRFKNIVIANSENTHELLTNTMYYTEIILFCTILFFLPIFPTIIYLSFKIKNRILFCLSIIATITGEYFYYTYMASTSDYINGVYNGLITILFLALFFYKAIAIKMSNEISLS